MFAHRACAFIAGFFALAAHGAQPYPAKPVRVVVPFAAGGTFDTVARVTAQKLSDTWGQQVIVDNRPGGATIIATELVAKATADGYTLLLSPNALSANPALHRKLPYDALKDFSPVALLAAQPMALGAHPSFSANNVKELVEFAKAKPGKLSYGTAGVGSGGYLAGEIFKGTAGIDIVHVSYKGGNMAMIEVIANQIPLVMTGLPNLLPQMKAGKLKILGITDGSRSPVAQDIPTIGETVPGYSFRNWFGIIAPRATPTGVVKQLNQDLNRALKAADVQQKLVTQGFIVIGGTEAEFAKVIEDDTRKFAEVLKRSGISPK
jgi:tripartite-type tricarboxylate transporter receptor subunit TctC